jgi:ABC-type phosphate transport system substrate-binding protein
MRSVDRRAWLCVGVSVVLMSPCPGSAHDSNNSDRGTSRLRIIGSFSGLRNQEAVAKVFCRSHPNVDVMVSGRHHNEGVKEFCAGGADILMYSGPARWFATASFKLAFGRNSQAWPRRYLYGQYCVNVVVHPSNPITKLTVEQLRDTFEGRTASWKQVGGKAAPISKLIWERLGLKGREIFMNEVQDKWHWDKNCVACWDCYEVAGEIVSDRNAIGLCFFAERRSIRLRVSPWVPTPRAHTTCPPQRMSTRDDTP